MLLKEHGTQGNKRDVRRHKTLFLLQRRKGGPLIGKRSEHCAHFAKLQKQQ